MHTYEIKPAPQQLHAEFMVGYYKAPGRQVFVPMGTASTQGQAKAMRAEFQREALEREAKHRAKPFVPGRPVFGFYSDEQP